MKKKLVVVAHPDDETLFFSGLFLSEPRTRWTVVCSTDGDTAYTRRRRSKDLPEAAKRLGISKVIQLPFVDNHQKRISLKPLEKELRLRLSGEKFDEVYTHGIFGEYGHPHHQDVCLAVHRVFSGGGSPAVWSVASDERPDRRIDLPQTSFATKLSIMTGVYGNEFKKFCGLIPVTASEGFCRRPLRQVEQLYTMISSGKVPEGASIPPEIAFLIKSRRRTIQAFFEIYFR